MSFFYEYTFPFASSTQSTSTLRELHKFFWSNCSGLNSSAGLSPPTTTPSVSPTPNSPVSSPNSLPLSVSLISNHYHSIPIGSISVDLHTQSLRPSTNVHPMQTRSKTGTLKPKSSFCLTAISSSSSLLTTEPKTVTEALTS